MLTDAITKMIYFLNLKVPVVYVYFCTYDLIFTKYYINTVYSNILNILNPICLYRDAFGNMP